MASVVFASQFDNKNNWRKKGRRAKQRKREREREKHKCQPPKKQFSKQIFINLSGRWKKAEADNP